MSASERGSGERTGAGEQSTEHGRRRRRKQRKQCWRR